MKNEHKQKTHGYAMVDLQLQKMYVNTVILQLVGIQMINLFLNHVYQYEVMVRKPVQIHGQGQKDEMMEILLMKADQVTALELQIAMSAVMVLQQVHHTVNCAFMAIILIKIKNIEQDMNEVMDSE